MNGDDDRTELILKELRALRRTVRGLGVLVVLCTIAAVLAVRRPEAVVEIIVFLGVVSLVGIVATILGEKAGRTINRLKSK
jgi:hypothetical protein